MQNARTGQLQNSLEKEKSKEKESGGNRKDRDTYWVRDGYSGSIDRKMYFRCHAAVTAAPKSS